MADCEGQREQQREEALAVPEQGHDPVCSSTEELPYPTLAPVVCFGLQQTTRPRNWCLQMTCSPWLDNVSKMLIVLHCVCLSMYKPYEERTSTLVALEVSVFAFFMVEMLIKMVALGVFGHKGSYLSNNWNKFDVFISSGGMLDIFLASLGIHWKFSQIVGPMRLISRVPSMRHLMTILLDSMPMLANVLILCFIVVHVFAVMGVQLWAGQLRNRCFLGEDIPTKYNVSLSPYYVSKYGEKFPFICSPDDNNGMMRCHDVPPYHEDGQTCSLAAPHHALIANELVPTEAGARVNTCVNWNMYYNVCRAGDRNPHMGATNFDNIGFAWIAIFQVVTLEGWTEIMSYVMDANSCWSFVFFVLVTIMGSFIMMNVGAVVIVTHFSENMILDKEEQGAGTEAIAELWSRSRHHNRVHADPHGGSRTRTCELVWNPLRRKLKRIVKGALFNGVMMFFAFVCILTMSIEHHGQPKELTHATHIINIILTIVFVVEMTLKLLALSWTYFRDRQNIFDFVIVIVSLWEVTANVDGRLSALRAVRLLRFVRMVYFLTYLRRQLLLLTRTMKKAVVLCRLLLFTIFIFSILGMQLFGGKFSFITQKGETITHRKNFDTLLSSTVTVFQILTLENWNLVLYNAMAATSPWAALYFVAVIVFGKHVLLNILVGIVVQSFQDDDPSEPNSDCSLSRSGPSSPTAINSAPEEESAPADTNEDNTSLNLKQIVLRWCKEHEDWSLYVLSPQNRFRVCCQRVISHKMFDHGILFFILINSVTIAMERPGIDPKSTERWILIITSYLCSAVFLVEMLFKVLALGLLFGKESYCRSAWNVMDGLLVTLSVVHILVSLASTGNSNIQGILKVFRLLRTFRPLRVIKRVPKLRLAIETLIASAQPIWNIIVICCFFFFFFGLLGVQLFKGKFFSCVGEDTRNITSKTECLSANYRWVRKQYNFDSLPQALMSLFVMYSKDGWLNIMYDGMDAVGVDKQPVKNYNEWMGLYFISFMMMSFVLLDTFIGVMVETFHQCQQEQKQNDTEVREVSQDQCREPEQVPYYTNYSPMRRSIHTLSTSNFLDLFMTVIIFISVLMMAFEHYNQPQYIEKLVEYSNYVFTAILIIEVLLKLVAFGAWRFIKISWNLLDVTVILVSVISIIFNKMKMAHSIPLNPSILRVCRVLRLAQVLKTKKVRVLLNTIIKTLSQVGNICFLFIFFFFIYAALGVELFGKLECSEDHPCLGLHRHANFRHFGMALLTLYQVCTGDNWSSIMKDTLRECRPGDHSCWSYLSWASPICFISFVVLAQFVLVNLVVAVIMQALEDSRKEEEEEQVASPAASRGESGIQLQPSAV